MGVSLLHKNQLEIWSPRFFAAPFSSSMRQSGARVSTVVAKFQVLDAWLSGSREEPDSPASFLRAVNPHQSRDIICLYSATNNIASEIASPSMMNAAIIATDCFNGKRKTL
jgi:hypothetical protein